MASPIIENFDRISPPWIYPRPAFATASTQGETVSGFLGGPPLPLPIHAAPSTIGALSLYFAGDFYYRIWMIPPILEERSPTIGVPVYFKIWNAYPWKNIVTSVTATDADGLSVSIASGDVFEDLETRQGEIVIGQGAPSNIEAKYVFAFDDGSGSLSFLASLSAIMFPVPNVPVLEEWEWLTDVMTATDGTEQRLAARSVPRRRMSTNYHIENDEDWRLWSRFVYSKLGGSIEMPLYQYATYLTAPTAAGGTDVTFDPSETDLRDGERIGLWNPVSLSGAEGKIASLTATGAVLSKGLSDSVKAGYYVVPLAATRYADGIDLAMRSISGTIRLKVDVLDVKTPLPRPGAAPSYHWIDEKIVLSSRPLAKNDVPSVYSIGQSLIDGESGVHGFTTHWPHPKIGGVRDFHVKRGGADDEMDWWRGFLNAIKGRQKTFLMPTWRKDFTLAAPIGQDDSIISLLGLQHEAIFFQFPMNAYLQIESQAGVDRAKIRSVSEDRNANLTSVDLEAALRPHDVDATVSLLQICRLDTDTVKLTHQHDHSFVQLQIRVIDE